MAKRLDHYKTLAEKMIEADKDRDRMFKEYDKAWHLDWDLPESLRDKLWVRQTITTEPHDVIAAGVRMLAATDPVIEYQPLYGNQETKELANEWEKVLLWQLKSASRRRQAPVWRDFVHSALMYHEITAQVIDLDYQIEQKQFAGASSNRLKAMRRYGRYMINVYNPRNVHVRYSNVMPEAVLLCQRMYASQILAEFGDLARGIKSQVEKDEYALFDVYDYTDLDVRAVWAMPADGDGDDIVILRPKEHELPFLCGWIARVGGSTLEGEEQHKRHPLLYPVIQSDSWETANIIESLTIGNQISTVAFPQTAEEGGNTEEAIVDYDTPGGKIKVPAGNTVKQLAPPALNTGLVAVGDRLEGKMLTATGGNILQQGELRSGLSYAALNLHSQISIGALRPYKELAEAALADACESMLLWAHYTEKDIHAWGTGKQAGVNMKINADEISTDAIYITAELKPDVVTDRIQRINAATMAVQNLGLSKERGLKEAGVEDPQAEMKQHYYELLVESMVQDRIRRQQAMTDIELQQIAMQAQQQAQMMAQAMMQPPQQGMMQPPGIPGIQGQGDMFNPAAGGLPPAMAQPGATREEQTGYDMYGVPGADLEGMEQ
jgi:hypothetical protein